MADRSPPHQLQVHPQRHFDSDLKGYQQPKKGPSTSTIIAVITLLPVGGTLLALSGITLAGTVIGLAITTPLFILFSPILVPAAVVIGLAATAFLASGAFGLTALSSFSWVLDYIRQATGRMPDQLDLAKRRMQEMAGHVSQKTKDVGQEIQTRAQEGKRG